MGNWLRFRRDSEDFSSLSRHDHRKCGRQNGGGRSGESGEHRNQRHRLARLETLESRQMLTVSSVSLFGSSDVAVGSPSYIGINGVAGDNEKVTYSISIDASNLTSGKLNYELLTGKDNRSLKINVKTADSSIDGTLLLQLFEEYTPETIAKITALAESGAYDGSTFHRMITNFMIQGGIVSEDVAMSDDEFVPELQFTTPGLLAMANSGKDTNSSQFFITTGQTRWLDYEHTIFGMLTEGGDILESLNSKVASSSGTPAQTTNIVNVDVVNDIQNAVLKLTATEGTKGTANLTIVATGEDGVMYSKTITVTVAEDADGTTVNPLSDPAFGTIEPISLTAGETVTGTLPVINMDGRTLEYSFATKAGSASATALTVSLDTTTGKYTVTAAAGTAAGVYEIYAKIRAADSDDGVWEDAQTIPVLVTPAAPTVQLAAESDTGTSDSDHITALNNSAGKTLKFELSGLTTGAMVRVYAGDTIIASGTATSTTMTLESNGTKTLIDGTYSVTAEQYLTLNSASAGNAVFDSVTSERSAAFTLTVSTANNPPTANAATVQVNPRVENSDTGTVMTLTGDDGEANLAQTLSYTIATQPKHGTLTAVEGTPGKYLYTPEVGYTGTDSFTFKVTDTDLAGADSLTSAAATVTLNVVKEEEGTKPTANDVTESMYYWKKTVTIQLAGSLEGVDGTLKYEIVSQPVHGTIVSFDTTTGVVVYAPDSKFRGLDTIKYAVINTKLATSSTFYRSETASVSVNVVAYNRVPKTYKQKLTMAEDGSITIQLSGTNGEKYDYDQGITYQILVKPAHGTLEVIDAEAGTYRYTPKANYNGYDFIFFRVRDDGFGGLTPRLYSAVKYVRIKVTAVNDDPTAYDQTIQMNQDAAKRVVVLRGNDGDRYQYQALTFAITQEPEHGTISDFNAKTGVLWYKPSAGFSGTEVIKFTVTDSLGAKSNEAELTINVKSKFGSTSSTSIVPDVI